MGDPLSTSKCQHGQYRTLKVEYLLPMPTYTKINDNYCLDNFRYKKFSKPCPQLLRYQQPVPYLTINASMDNTILKGRVFPMLAFTKSTSFQTFRLIGVCIGIEMSIISPLFTSKCQHGQYRTLKVEYLLPMPAFTKIIVIYNFRHKKLQIMNTIIEI